MLIIYANHLGQKAGEGLPEESCKIGGVEQVSDGFDTQTESHRSAGEI